MAIEIVDLPINSMMIFHSYFKRLPEGIFLSALTRAYCSGSTAETESRNAWVIEMDLAELSQNAECRIRALTFH